MVVLMETMLVKEAHTHTQKKVVDAKMVITFDYLAASLKQRSPWNCEIWVILKLRIGQSYSKNDGGHDLHLCLDFFVLCI